MSVKGEALTALFARLPGVTLDFPEVLLFKSISLCMEWLFYWNAIYNSVSSLGTELLPWQLESYQRNG